MADLTLMDVWKNMKDSPEKGAIWTYALENHVTRNIPTPTEPTGVMSWSIFHDHPYSTSAAGTRGIGDEFTATKTPVQPFKSNFKIYGGRVQQDRILKLLAPGETSIQKGGQLRAAANIFMKDVFEGAGGKYIYGIQGYIDTVPLFANQVVYAGTISTPGLLTQDILDEAVALHNVQPGRTFMYMNNAPLRRVHKISRGMGGTTAFEGQAIRYAPGEFGQNVAYYGDIQLVGTVDGKGTDILSNTAGDGVGTTVYIVTYGEENFTAFQLKDIYTVGMQGVSVTEAFDLEWPVGTAARSQKCITMIKYVKNAIV